MGLFVFCFTGNKNTTMYTSQGCKDYMTLIQIFSDHLSNKIHTPQFQEAVWYHGERWNFFTLHSNIYEVSNDISWGDLNDQDISILCPHTLCKYERNIMCCDWKGGYETIQKGQNTLRGTGMAFLGKGWNLHKRHPNRSKCFQEWMNVCSRVYEH